MQVAELVRRNYSTWDGKGGILDFCAGGGEVTTVLQECGCKQLSGSDPFTWALYEKNTGIVCHKWSFEDVIRNGCGIRYSTIVCSFAMHLCPQKQLFPLVWNLLEAAPQLVIISPHKRPELEHFEGIRLVSEDEVFTERGKKVRLKTFRKR